MTSLFASAAVAAGEGMTAVQAGGAGKRPLDPWVFRSVLDGRARMLTVALDDKLYVAYDTQDGTLRRAWPGGVLFTGGVYDARHGPQPQSVGKPYYAAGESAHDFTVIKDGKPVDAKYVYLGYRLAADEVTLRFAYDTPDGRVNVEESPGVEHKDDAVVLVRTIKVSGLPAGTSLKVALLGDGDATTRPAGVAGDAVKFDHDGTVAVRNTWSIR